MTSPQSLLPSIRRAKHVVAAATVVLVLVVTAAAIFTAQSGQQQHEALVDRFNTRQAVGGQFIEAYVQSVYERERALAGHLFTGPVNGSSFASSAADLGFNAAVLLDAEGRLLASQPANPDVIGRNLTAGYTHLRTAVKANTPAVSGVVPSAIRGDPVVGLAVPFATPSGRRVFSGAYAIAATPLVPFARSATPFRTAQVFIIDAGGMVVAGNDPATDGRLLSAIDAQLSRFQPDRGFTGAGDQRRYVSTGAIAGTPWRLILTVRTAELYAPWTPQPGGCPG